MRVLSLQVPQKLWRNAGSEAGVNVGVLLTRATNSHAIPAPEHIRRRAFRCHQGRTCLRKSLGGIPYARRKALL